MKKNINIFSIISTLVLSGFTTSLLASDKLCLASNNDCTFVLLSENISETVSEIIDENLNARTGDSSEKVMQTSSVSEANEILSIVNEARAKERLSPFSTFKIPNSLIALDSKLITSAKQSLTYDKEKYPTEAWWPSTWQLSEYNLAAAFKFSIVPIYRQIATDIGEETMKTYIENFTYGNEDISSGLDNFWLNGSLKISAIEQIEFLQKLNQGHLGVSQQSLDTLKAIMLVETTDNYLLYAKTGTGTIDNMVNDETKSSTLKLGWYVGFVENSQGVHYFAFNFSRNSYNNMNTERIEIVRNHLRKAGVIDQP
ncbi:penicillin-binding transpeptidase domain-containing protein [Colwellia echini]|uniref:Beta-lactamase n=1 Tax=Colwellia echini TaxID=1982103 RepID=A0ABY3MVJ7_9GAMM|nr:penicillin-binding transpeptidase domain-containing protein [Colwellia echini]TYK65236.1 class D beta-lactamase [Colwellia echini]